MQKKKSDMLTIEEACEYINDYLADIGYIRFYGKKGLINERKLKKDIKKNNIEAHKTEDDYVLDIDALEQYVYTKKQQLLLAQTRLEEKHNKETHLTSRFVFTSIVIFFVVLCIFIAIFSVTDEGRNIHEVLWKLFFEN